MSQSENALSGKTVVLGISGGIAAYKSAELVRLLRKRGALVFPVVTEAGSRFVTPLTFEALAGNRVASSLWDDRDPIPHTSLGQSADVVVVAPATADLIARFRAGLADDLLTATLLATRAPVVFCPAMHSEMWESAATQENLAVLRSRGVRILDPAEGQLAGGDSGIGRMREPCEVVEAIEEVLKDSVSASGRPPEGSALTGKRVLVTAGGTREPIDPVRYIGNRSSGKMGHALASAARDSGAVVTLVTTSDVALPTGVDVIRVETASEMEKEVVSRFDDVEIVLMAAAVADFRPKAEAASKIKKAMGSPVIELEPTSDILALLGARKGGQFIAGFAAETDDLIANAARKLDDKNVDLIVANDVSQPDAGFEVDTNRVVLLWRTGRQEELPLSSKAELAVALVDRVARSLTG